MGFYRLKIDFSLWGCRVPIDQGKLVDRFCYHTAPAPTIAPRLIVTPHTIVAPEPIEAP